MSPMTTLLAIPWYGTGRRPSFRLGDPQSAMRIAWKQSSHHDPTSAQGGSET